MAEPCEGVKLNIWGLDSSARKHSSDEEKLTHSDCSCCHSGGGSDQEIYFSFECHISLNIWNSEKKFNEKK